jgi:hypothetical protein
MRRNPGVCCLYVVKRYSHRKKPKGGGVIFRAGPAARVVWYTQGRPANRSEVLDAINASLLAIGGFGDERAVEKRVAELVPV